MANLSDLTALPVALPVVPRWIAALGSGGGFREQAIAPRADGIEEDCVEADPQSEHGAELAAAYARGQADALAEMAQRRGADEAANEALALAFARLDAAARSALSERLAEAVAGLCEHMIEPAMVDRAAIARRCAALAEAMGDVAGQCSLHLHPDDVPLLSADTRRDWAICPDPSLQRGTLLLEHADGAVADGPEEWRRLIAAALSA
jgi:flagellar assembly protein FliH